MNTIQKMMLALLLLGILPGAVLAMDDEKKPDSEGDIGHLEVGMRVGIPKAIVAEAAGEDEDDKNFFDCDEELIGAVDPTVPTSPSIPAIVSDVTAVPVPGLNPTVTANPGEFTVVLPVDQPVPFDVVVNPPQGNPQVPAVNPPVLQPEPDQAFLAKIQPFMTKTSLLGLTGLVTAVIGLRYLYVSSVIKQVADLQALRAQCDATLDAVLQGETDPDLVEVPLVACVGLNDELQDKLDDALSGYNIALQQLCHELCAQNGQMADSTQEQHARKAVAVCQAVIDECQQVLVKKPTLVDTALKKGSILAQALSTQVKSTTHSLARKFKRQDAKKA